MARMIFLFVLAMSSSALYASDSYRGSSFEGIFHNNRVEGRASLDAYGKLYWLDFRGVDLSDVAERHDRERVIVHGSISYPWHNSRPVLFVDSITFRPYGRALTYNLNEPRRYIERRYYTTHPRERTVIREYEYR